MFGSKRKEMKGTCRTLGRDEICIHILVGKSEGERRRGRSSSKCEDNTRMDLREIGWWVWIGCIWLRVGTSGVFLD
jgi:hypothetical protein